MRRSKDPDTLYLKVNVIQAKNVSATTNVTDNNHLFASVAFNDQFHTTIKATGTNDPYWNQSIVFRMDSSCKSSTVVVTCWNKDSSGTTYSGEARINILDVFHQHLQGLSDPKTQAVKVGPKWFKLYSSQERHTYVTGTVIIEFQLHRSKPKKRAFKILSKNRSNVSLTSAVSSASSQSRKNSPIEESKETFPPNDLYIKWASWLSHLEHKTTEIPNDQGFYSSTPILTSDNDINKTLEVNYDLETGSPIDDSNNEYFTHNMGLDNDDNSMFSDFSDSSSITSGNSEMSTEVNKTSDIGSPTSGQFLVPPQPKRGHRKKAKQSKSSSAYELRSFRNVKGVLFLEIISAHDLPKFKNLTRTGFDMDPFVVVSFGKRTFRTSWRKHTLNPIFNERLAFEILDEEIGFNLNLSVLDRDSLTFHDRVAEITIPVTDIIDMSTNFLDPEIEVEESTVEEPTSTPRAIRSGLLRKKIKPLKVLSREEEKKFLKFDLPLEFSKTNSEKYSDKYNPILKVRCRFEPYEDLRKDLWRLLLRNYDLNDDNRFTYLELSAFLDILGSTLSHQVIVNFFKKFNKSIESDLLTVEEVVICLEELIKEKRQLRENKEYNPEIFNKETPGEILKIDNCPVCGKSRLSQRGDIDIITHVAICGSKDRSSVQRLIKANYVSPSFATKRWYSRALINLGYGKVKLGANNANILVQDRRTGIILEEKMSVYVRVGIRLLYRHSNYIQMKKAKKFLKKITFQQGAYYDSPKSKKDIEPFVKFHNLDLSECICSIDEFNSFNEFFYRQLKPNARPLEAPDNKNIVSSTADCRCTAFNSISSAMKVWIKGKSFTIPKLFAGRHPEVMRKLENCSIGIFRLAPQDYHRFHSPVNGFIGKPEFIEGEYFTVNPMAVRSHLDVFGENCRCIIPIETETFGTVVVIPVGAMMVGATILTVKEGDQIERGQELGYFKFGGSTLLVLFQENKMLFDSDLVSNSMSGIETLVRVGMSVGHQINEQEVLRERKTFEDEPEEVRLKIIRTITGISAEDSIVNDIKSLSWEASNMTINDNRNSWNAMNIDEDI